MANIRVSLATGDDTDGLTWAKALNDIKAGINTAGIGDDIWVGDDHVETIVGSITYDGSFDTTAPKRVIAVDTHVTDPPTGLKSSRFVVTAGNTEGIFFTGNLYVENFEFALSGSSTSDINIGNDSTNFQAFTFNNCKFSVVSTGSSTNLNLGGTASTSETVAILWLKCDLKFGRLGARIDNNHSIFLWFGGSYDAAAIVPTSLYSIGIRSGNGKIVGVDLSGLTGSGKSILTAPASAGFLRLVGCKVGATFSWISAAPTVRGASIEAIACDDGSGEFQHYWEGYEGSFEAQSTIFRDAGAFNDVSNFSYEFITGANCTREFPIFGPWLDIFFDTTGAKTLTINIINDGTTFQNDEVWLEIEYLDTAGVELLKLEDTRNVTLATPANLTTNSLAWTGTGGFGSAIKQHVAKTVTVNAKGAARCRLVVGIPSETLYVDGKVEIT